MPLCRSLRVTPRRRMAMHLRRSLKPGLGSRTSTKWRGDLRLEILEDRTLLSTWVPKGPDPILTGSDPASGRITAVAGDLTDPNTIYIAAAGGGVWKTTDGGTDWTSLTDAQSTLFMGALAL